MIGFRTSVSSQYWFSTAANRSESVPEVSCACFAPAHPVESAKARRAAWEEALGRRIGRTSAAGAARGTARPVRRYSARAVYAGDGREFQGGRLASRGGGGRRTALGRDAVQLAEDLVHV